MLLVHILSVSEGKPLINNLYLPVQKLPPCVCVCVFDVKCVQINILYNEIRGLSGPFYFTSAQTTYII